MKPNVLILMTDQLNFKCLSYKNHPVVQTPNLDALKRKSVEFTRCYVQNAFCAPSRTSYFTGQYLFTHRQYGFHGLVAEDTPSMPAFFAEQGYETFHCGKAHLNCLGERMGFTTFIPTLPEDSAFATNLENSYQAYCRQRGYSYPTDQAHGGDRMMPVRKQKTDLPGYGQTIGTSCIPKEDSLEAYTSAKAIEFLTGRRASQPFFMHVSFDRPHPPLSPSEPYDNRYDPQSIPLMDGFSEQQLQMLPEHIRNLYMNNPNSVVSMGTANMQKLLAHYYGLITHIDEEIGTIMKALEEYKLYDNTIILFYSDHGDMAGNNGLSNKFSNEIFHDDIIRTPMLVKLPDQAKAGLEVDTLTEAVDVFPTLASLCGLDCSALQLQGRNMFDHLNDSTTANADRVAFSESYGIKAIVQGHWKLIYYVNSDEGELFDLVNDPGERDNLYESRDCRDKVTSLKLEIVKKMTKPVSERRKQWIRSLFDNSTTEPFEMMEKLYKWNRSIADGSGFWMVCRDGYRFTCLPFDKRLILERPDSTKAVANRKLGMIESEETQIREQLLNELLNYLATTIRPISLMSGNQHTWDNMLQTKGPGLC